MRSLSRAEVKPDATIRICIAPAKDGQLTPTPAAFVAVERISLFDALASPDTGDGSFTGPRAKVGTQHTLHINIDFRGQTSQIC